MDYSADIIIDQDTQWKELIEDLFEEWLAFFMPNVFEQTDFSIPPEFLDKEFPKLLPEFYKGGNILNDRLVKIQFKSGESQFLIVHIEVQSEYEKEFSKRMFKYFYRIFDKYGENIESIAILTDSNKKFHPDTYTYKKFATKLTFNFRTCKLEDYQEKELATNDNPFAIAVLANQYLNRTRKDKNYDLRLQFKRQLARLMFERNYSRKKVEKLLLFIANMLALPKDLEMIFRTEVTQKHFKSDTMPLTFENSVLADTYRYEGILIGRNEGMEKGMEKGQFYNNLLVALNCIKQNFDDNVIIRITSLPVELVRKIRKLHEQYGEKADGLLKKEFGIEF